MFSCSHCLKPWPLLPALGLATLGLATPRPAPAQVAVLTQNNDLARSGSNTVETALTPATVNVNNFGKLFTISGLGANVNGQPLYAPYIPIGSALHNVVFAYTSNNSNGSPCGLFAFDADTGAKLWTAATPANTPPLSPSAQYTTATPVIDLSTNTIYVLSKSNDDNGATYLRAFDITTGQQKAYVQVTAQALGTGDGSFKATSGPYAGQSVVAFDGPSGAKDKNGNPLRFHANDRAGLLLLNNTVYVAFAFNSDAFPYHGWIFGYTLNGTSLTQKYVFCTTPNGGDGGVWMAGKGLTADASGNIYCSVGNGKFDAAAKGITSGTDYGMCYLKLTPSLTVEDWYAPYDEAVQSNADNDLGNTGLVGIPGTNRLYAGATKFGAGFLLDSTNLGHMPASAQTETALQRLNGLSANDDVGQNPIAWDTGSYKYIYVWPGGHALEQLRYDPGVGNLNPPSPATHTSSYPSNVFQKGSDKAGGSLAVSSNGMSDGILWAVGSNGVVHAYDASNVTTELWNSSMNSSRDSLGSVGHFQFPTVVNGKVYVPDGTGDIVVYGLLSTYPGQPLYELYASANNDHLYSVNTSEVQADASYYGLVGTIGYAPVTGSVSGLVPVTRFFNPSQSYQHFLTARADVAAYVLAHGWVSEGPKFSVYPSAGTGLLPLHQLYSPMFNRHYYTTSQSDYAYWLMHGLDDEGIVGYVRAGP